MGGGTYSSVDRSARYISSGHVSENLDGTVDYASSDQFFQQRSINNAMNPHGIKIRESRDSEEHPNSLATIIALDVTGSMGSIPYFLVQNGLPNLMDSVIEKGIKDPQVLFLGIGDHECDQSPLQVSQFESSDELLDHWLQNVYLEGGGGGNYGESYLLAWYFAAYHTSIDCFEKRKQKGFLFTIGDEPTLRELPKNTIKGLMGDGQYENYTAAALLDKAKEKYNVFHIHVKEGANGNRQEIIDGWKQIAGNNLIIADRKEDISTIISETIISNTSAQTEGINYNEVVSEVKEDTTNQHLEDKKEEMML